MTHFNVGDIVQTRSGVICVTIETTPLPHVKNGADFDCVKFLKLFYNQDDDHKDTGYYHFNGSTMRTNAGGSFFNATNFHPVVDDRDFDPMNDHEPITKSGLDVVKNFHSKVKFQVILDEWIFVVI